MAVFQAAELLIPREELLEDWAVIACDQFTSQPEYWQAVRARVGEKPSAYHLVFPEAELGRGEEARIASINAHMREYLAGDVFRTYPDAYVYVERTLLDGSVRRGVVGVIDLECYDYRSQSETPVRATEQTVTSRIPPRVKIRGGAPLEASHALLLMDDRRGNVLNTLETRREELPLLYAFDLMQGGGHIEGRLVTGTAAAALEAALQGYEAETAARFSSTGKAPLLYAVGDGNHSLATAKTCWETLKEQQPALTGTKHPARYAMVELQNIRDEAQRFEPIHRLLTGVEVSDLLREAEAVSAPGGHAIDWAAGERQGTVFLDPELGALPVAALQRFLDRYLRSHSAHIDYIHGAETAMRLAGGFEAMCFLLPDFPKESLFHGIVLDGVLPRKTFSMGHAQEKRYYLECRRITE